MKNLANCKPSEFLKQTNIIRKKAAKWLKDTDILNIRKHQPEIPEGADYAERKRLMDEQVRKNLSEILDAALEKYPDETLEIIALVCFVEPEKVDEHPISEYIGAVSEIIGSEAVIGFFTSLGRLGQMTI